MYLLSYMNFMWLQRKKIINAVYHLNSFPIFFSAIKQHMYVTCTPKGIILIKIHVPSF